MNARILYLLDFQTNAVKNAEDAYFSNDKLYFIDNWQKYNRISEYCMWVVRCPLIKRDSIVLFLSTSYFYKTLLFQDNGFVQLPSVGRKAQLFWIWKKEKKIISSVDSKNRPWMLCQYKSMPSFHCWCTQWIYEIKKSFIKRDNINRYC